MRGVLATLTVVAAIGLTACGGDEETTTAPTAPESAGDPSTGAPDEGISEKPGGSESSGGGY